MIQLITPNPNIPCKPGWCLQYVRQAFNLPAAYPTATAAWNASTSKHRDRLFPRGVWFAVWFALANEPAGHVALMAPDGSVYSTSDLGNKPHHHPDLSDLMNFYERYDMRLTYLGWTEDVAGYPVITSGGLAAAGTTTTPAPEEIDMAAEQNILARLKEIVEWTSGEFQKAKENDERNRNALAEFVRDAVNSKDTLTAEDLDAKLAALKGPTVTLVKGDAEATVYAWDGGTGYRALGYDEFALLMSTGAELKVEEQAKIDANK